MADETRHSRALEPTVVSDPDQLARLEVFNTVQQYLKIEEMVGYFLDPDRPFKLRPSHILTLHRAALDGISASAGVWRPSGVEIGGAGIPHLRPLRSLSELKSFAITSTKNGPRRVRCISPPM